MKRIYQFIVLVVITGLAFTSCEKEKESTASLDYETQVSEDDALASDIFDDVINDVEFLETAYSLKSAEAVVCRTVDREWKGDTLCVTITYSGECENEVYNRTRKRSGQIFVKHFGGPRYMPGATRIITFSEYYINDVKVEGEHSIVSQGFNEDSTAITYLVEVNNGTLTFEDGTVVTRNAEKTRLHYFGENRYDLSDDYWIINGTSTGTNFRGDTYSRTISNLKALKTCLHFVSGTVTINLNDEAPVMLNYGEGECDDKALVSKNGESKQITLREKRNKNRK